MATLGAMAFDAVPDGDRIYPVQIVSQRDEVIARINPNNTWSVKWDAVIAQAYEPLTATNITIGALSRLLMAGRDNFLISKWDTVYVPWEHQSFLIGPYLPDLLAPPFSLIGPTGLIGWVNRNGQWSVNWNEVYNTRKLCDNITPGFVAIGGFCQLLLAAKDNFITMPIPKV